MNGFDIVDVVADENGNYVALKNVGSKWIPVSERLPEIEGDFLTSILFEDGDMLVDISFWFDRCWTTPDM